MAVREIDLRRGTWVYRRVGGMPQGFWVIFTGMGLARIGWFVVPFRVLYLTHERLLDAIDSSLVLTGFGAGWALSQPLGGLLADKIGRKATIVGGAWTTAATFLAFGSAQTPGILAMTAAAMGLSFELHRPAAQALTVDSAPASCRPRALALLYLIMNVGRGVGCVMAGLLADKAFWMLFVANAVLNIAFGTAVLVMLQDQPSRRAIKPVPRLRTVLRDARLIAFTAITISFYFVLLQSVVTLPIIIGESGGSPLALGLVLCVGPFAVAASQLVLQRWLTPDDANAVRRRAVALLICAIGAPTVGIGLAITGAGSSLAWVASTTAIWMFGEVAFLAVAPGIVASLAPSHLRGTYFGLWGCCQGVAAVGAPAASELLVRVGGAELLWRTCAFAATIAGIGCLLLRAAGQRHLPSLPQAETG